MHSAEDSQTTVEYGPVAVLHDLATRIQLVETVDGHTTKAKGVPVGALVEIMAINRVLDPKAKLEIPEWYYQTYLPELLGVELSEESGYQTLTRAYDYLPESAQVDIEMELAERVRAVFQLKDDTFLYDLTTTFVEGEGEADILRNGFSKDHRPDAKQVSYGLTVGRDEPIPLFHLAHPGNTHDSKTVDALMDRFHDRLGLKGCLIVDRGIVTAANVKEIVDERGHDLVGGLKRTGSIKRWMREVPLEDYSEPFMVGKEELRSYGFEHVMKGKKRRAVLYYSEVKRERDERGRSKRLVKAEKELEKISAAVARSRKNDRRSGERIRAKVERLLKKRKVKGLIMWKLTGGRGGRRLKYWRDDEAIAEVALEDGKQAIVTTLDLSPEELLVAYRDRTKIERAFRITKSNIRIRPIWNRREEHILAHLFVCFLAYLLSSLMELDMKRKGIKRTAEKMLKKLRRERAVVERELESDEGAREYLQRLGVSRGV